MTNEAVLEFNPAFAAAGRVVVAMATGGFVGDVDVDDSPRIGARVPLHAPWRFHIVMLLAGLIVGSETSASPPGLEILDLARISPRWDIATALRIITIRLGHPPEDDVIAEARRLAAAADRFVRAPKNSSVIRQIGDLLFARGTLTGSEIDAELGTYQFDMSPLNALK